MFPTARRARSAAICASSAGRCFGVVGWRRVACYCATLIAVLAQEPSTAPVVKPQPESNRVMATLLQRIMQEGDPMRNPFRSPEQIEILRQRIAQTTDVETLVSMKRALVRQLLQSGDARAALKENEALLECMRQRSVPMNDQDMDSLLTTSAICQLRIGEVENCLDQHNADSCLFPIRGGGVYQLQQGSRGAIAVLTELLQRFPGDLRARWLINIAYMTLGEYPEKVPSAWVIDPAVFASEYDIKRFRDVAPAVGLDTNDLAGGVVLDDFDNDGLLDLMVSSWGRNGQLRLYRNNGDGSFTDHTVAAGLTGEVGALNLIQCDYNNDGYMDVLVLRGAWLHTEGHHPLSLLRNNGDFTFTDVTQEAGLLRFHPTQAAVCLDYDGDGWIDLFVANESDERDVNPCELFHNNGDGTFTECAAENGVDLVGFFKGVVSADYNNDGRPDLFLSRRGGPKILLRNDGPAEPSAPRGRWRFTDVAEDAGISDPEMSFSCWFWDYDNDGWPDLMVTGYAIQDVGDIAADYLGLPHTGERSHLYHNNGDGTFSDVSKAAGVNKLLHTMGCNFGDLDNDGWLDFYVGTGDPDFATLIPNRMFRNDGGRRFQDVTTSGGFGQLQKGHGIAFGDINNDGEQDIYSVVGGAVDADVAHRQLFANPGHGNHWLKLKLEGRRSNRAAIGARIKVVVQTEGVERAIYRTVGSGGSFAAPPGNRTRSSVHDCASGDNVAGDGTNPGVHWSAAGSVLPRRRGRCRSHGDAFEALRVAAPGRKPRRRRSLTLAMNRILLIAVLSLPLATVASPIQPSASGAGDAAVAPPANPAPTYPLSAYSALGSTMAQSSHLVELGWDEARIKAFLDGVEAAFRGRGYTADAQTRRLSDDLDHQIREQQWREKRREVTQPAGLAKFIKQARKEGNLRETDSGLCYRFLANGSGTRPRAQDTVVVSFECRTADDMLPVPSLAAENLKVKVTDLLPGLAEAVQMMTVGTQAILLLPPQLSFGAGAWPRQVERGVPLVFVVKLQQVLVPETARDVAR